MGAFLAGRRRCGLAGRRHNGRRGQRLDLAALQRLDRADQPAADLNLQLAVTDAAGDHTAAAHLQPSFDAQLALETAADIRRLDFRSPLEDAFVGHLDDPAVLHLGLDPALDDQMIAGGDLTGQGDAVAHDQTTGTVVARLWGGHGGISGRVGRIAAAGPLVERSWDIDDPTLGDVGWRGLARRFHGLPLCCAGIGWRGGALF